MAKQSAGILVFRNKDDKVEVFLVHPGGPFWAKKDDLAWSIPKGEYTDNEDPFEAAKREFQEEVGQMAPDGDYLELGHAKQKGGKDVAVWAVEKDLGDVKVESNTFSMEWPPRSGRQQDFPEVDKAAWFELGAASRKLHPGQQEFLKTLASKLGVAFTEQAPDPDDKLSDKQISLL